MEIGSYSVSNPPTKRLKGGGLINSSTGESSALGKLFNPPNSGGMSGALGISGRGSSPLGQRSSGLGLSSSGTQNQLFGSNSSGSTGLLFGQNNRSTNIFGTSSNNTGSLGNGPSIFGSNSSTAPKNTSFGNIFGNSSQNNMFSQSGSSNNWLTGNSAGNTNTLIFGGSKTGQSTLFGVGSTTNSPFGLGGSSNSPFGLTSSPGIFGGNNQSNTLGSTNIFGKPSSPFGIASAANSATATSNPFHSFSDTSTKPFGLQGNSSPNPFGNPSQPTSSAFDAFGKPQNNYSPFGQVGQNQGASGFSGFGSQTQQAGPFGQFHGGYDNMFGKSQSTQPGSFMPFSGQAGQRGLYPFGQNQPQQMQSPPPPPPPPQIPEAPDSLPNLISLLCQDLPVTFVDQSKYTDKNSEIDAETEIRESLVSSYRESIEAAREALSRQRDREERAAIETPHDVVRNFSAAATGGFGIGSSRAPGYATGLRSGALGGSNRRYLHSLDQLIGQPKGKVRNKEGRERYQKVSMGTGTKECKIVLESTFRVPRDVGESPEPKIISTPLQKQAKTSCFRYKSIVATQPGMKLAEFKQRCFVSIAEKIRSSNFSIEPEVKKILDTLEAYSDADLLQHSNLVVGHPYKFTLLTSFSSRSGELDEAATIDDWIDLSQPIRELFIDAELIVEIEGNIVADPASINQTSKQSETEEGSEEQDELSDIKHTTEDSSIEKSSADEHD